MAWRYAPTRADGWMTARVQTFEESPDSMKEGCRVMPGGGNPRESATEKRLLWCRAIAFGGSMAMVKRWGKSPPRTWQQGRHGKPHPEQRRIGASRGKVRITSRKRCRRPLQGHFSPEARVGSLTAVVTRLAEEWSSRGYPPQGWALGQNPAYRPSAQTVYHTSNSVIGRFKGCLGAVGRRKCDCFSQ